MVQACALSLVVAALYVFLGQVPFSGTGSAMFYPVGCHKYSQNHPQITTPLSK